MWYWLSSFLTLHGITRGRSPSERDYQFLVLVLSPYHFHQSPFLIVNIFVFELSYQERTRIRKRQTELGGKTLRSHCTTYSSLNLEESEQFLPERRILRDDSEVLCVFCSTLTRLINLDVCPSFHYTFISSTTVIKKDLSFSPESMILIPPRIVFSPSTRRTFLYKTQPNTSTTKIIRKTTCICTTELPGPLKE